VRWHLLLPCLAVSALAVALSAAPSFAPSRARADLSDVPYVVARGDTGHRIARRFGLRLPELAALNEGVDLEHLRAGQALVVGRGFRHAHRVLPGENVAAIASRWDVDVALVRAWNGLASGAALEAGDELTIYSDSAVPPSISIGRVDEGSLEHGVPIPSHDAWRVRTPGRAWVTHFVAEALVDGFEALRSTHPEAGRAEIRDASRPHGGHMREHHSHQSGRDVDIAYLRTRCRGEDCGHHWTAPSELDAEAEWALLHAWIERDLVEYVFVDHALQAPLYEAAREAGASRAELSRWFQYPRAEDVRSGIIRHVPRHADHLHVRFVCAPYDAACVPSDGSGG
jgi:LysM repeat protein